MPVFASLILLLFACILTPAQASPPLNPAALDQVDRATLAATQRGDVIGLEPYLAPNFQAAIKVPNEQGRLQTLLFNRAEFLLYAWNAAAIVRDYQVRTQTADYTIALDGRSAVGTRITQESLRWQEQTLRYSTQRTMHFKPGANRIQITLLEVQVLNWE